MASVLTQDSIIHSANDGPMAIINTAVEDSPSLAVQNYLTSKTICVHLEGRYAAKSMVNKLSLFNCLLNRKLRKETDMDYHIALMESLLSRLAAMGFDIDESMIVARSRLHQST